MQIGTSASSNAGEFTVNDSMGALRMQTTYGSYFTVSANSTGTTMYVSDGTNTTLINSTRVQSELLLQTSLAEVKKNITEFEGVATNVIKNSTIYEYNLKVEDDTDKKHIGFVIGDEYNTPKEVTAKNGEGIDTYSMSSIEWKAIQELIEQIQNLQERITVLEGE